ncbi:MAG: hypothetical protein Q8K75_07735 [Chlamydiales bacterium]|nr:hypothetical protein [Chlamydiales bacterium]
MSVEATGADRSPLWDNSVPVKPPTAEGNPHPLHHVALKSLPPVKNSSKPKVLDAEMHTIKLSRTEQKAVHQWTAITKKEAKAQIAVHKQAKKDIQTRIKGLKKVIDKAEPTGKSRVKIGKLNWQIKEKAPIDVRMAAYVQLTHAQKQLKVEKGELSALKEIVTNPIKKLAVRGLEKVKVVRAEHKRVKLRTTRKHKMEQEPGGNQELKLPPGPIAWIKLARSGIKNISAAKKLVHMSHQVSATKDLINKGVDKLHEIEEKLAVLPLDDPQIHDLKQQRQDINEAIEFLQDDLKGVQVISQLRKVITGHLSFAYKFTGMARALNTLVPLFVSYGAVSGTAASHVVTASQAFGIATAVVSIPLATILNALGIMGTLDNLATSVKDLVFVKGYRDNQLEALKETYEEYDDIIELQGDALAEHPEVHDLLVEANQNAHAIHKELHGIEQALVEGEKDKEDVVALKERRESLQAQLVVDCTKLDGAIIQRIAHATNDGEKKLLENIMSCVTGKRIVVSSTETIQKTIGPYIRQKAATKVGLETLRGLCDGLFTVSIGVGVAGFGLSVINGAGVPLLVASSMLGITASVGQIGGNLLIRKLRHLQLGDNRIRTATLTKEVMNRLEHEVRHWDTIEAAGLESKTTAHLMFEVLKTKYPSLPDDWGPKEWAQAIVTDPHGRHQKRFKKAVGLMHNHDHYGFIDRIVLKPISHLYKRYIRTKPLPEQRRAA